VTIVGKPGLTEEDAVTILQRVGQEHMNVIAQLIINPKAAVIGEDPSLDMTKLRDQDLALEVSLWQRQWKINLEHRLCCVKRELVVAVLVRETRGELPGQIGLKGVEFVLNSSMWDKL